MSTYSVSTGITHNGIDIDRYMTTGMYESYINGRFVRADTLDGMYVLIDDGFMAHVHRYTDNVCEWDGCPATPDNN